MNRAAVGALLGAGTATGLVLAIASAPPLRRPRLHARIAPYVRDSAAPSRLLSAPVRTLTPLPTLERLIRPILGDLVRVVDRAMGGVGSTRRRLDASGSDLTLEQFRVEQVLWGAGGLLGGVVLTLLLLASDPGRSPVPLLLLTVVTTLGGVVGRDRYLTHQVRERERRMVAEFPTVAELLALAVAAGEGPVAALERITTISRGELVRELARALADARAGASLVQALDGIARRTSLPLLARFVDGITIAVERGTPLAEVLRAQAVDVREAGKRSLMDAAGKKEIAMMMPIVFLILPTTILFLLYPGFVNLDISSP
ncbi:MAG: type II secretion system F family protein [Frankiaceae bacterium]